MKKIPLLTFLTAIIFLASPTAGFGAIAVSTASGGNWNAPGSWVGKIPGGGDDAVIVAGASMTITANANIRSITFSNNSAATAAITVNPGTTLTVTAGITNQNAATTSTSGLLQGNGTITCAGITVGGTTTPNGSGSDFTATLTSTVSNLTCSGALTVKALYNSGQSAANQGTFALSSGTVTAPNVSFVTVPFFGPMLTLATGNQSGTLVLSSATPFTFSGGGSSTFIPDGTNATVVYSGAGQTVNAETYNNLTLAGSGTKTSTGVTVNGVLTMQGTTTASAAPTYGPNAALEYNGSLQTNGPELTASLPNLIISNSLGVFLTNTTTVNHVLTLGTGGFAVSNIFLIIGTNGSIVGGSSNSYVAGNLRKNFSPGTQSFVFPVGDYYSYDPVIVSNLSVITAGAITVFTVSNGPPQISSSGIITNKDVNRYWVITNSSGSFGAYGATFNYPAADVYSGATPAQFAVSVLSGATWSLATVSGTPTTTATSIANQSGFGTFVIGDVAPIVWSGGGGANQSWSDGNNWLSGVSPQPMDNVYFFNNGAVSTVSNINNVVDAAFGGTVSSISYANTNNYHTTLINSGVTLNCISNFTVGTESYTTTTQALVATITGPGGTLNVNIPTNTSWTVRQGVASGTSAPGAPSATLNLSGLGTFTTVCQGIDIGVESTSIRRAAGLLYLAKTNVIYAAGVPMPGTTYSGNPAIYIGHNTQSGNQNSIGSAMYLGITNAIFSDYIVVGRANQTNNLMAFNPAFLGNSPGAYFRGFDGVSPVDLWVVGDNSPSGTITSPSSGTNDFTGGRLDALVQSMVIGRGAQNNQNNAAAPGTGTFTFDNGTLNVSTLYLGYQNLGTNIYSSGIGTMNVNGTSATLCVSNLVLAYATNTSIVSPSGTLNVRGGTVLANNISAAGGTAALLLTNATLVLSNTMGTPGSPLASVGITNSTLQFSVSGGSTNAVVSSLSTGGSNLINIAAVPVITSYPTQFTLIKYSGGIGGAGFNFGLQSLPPANPAYEGYISNNTANSSIVLVLTPPAAKLAVTSINGGANPRVGATFSVTVQSQDSSGTPRNVPTDTGVSLSLAAGSGTLGGTLTGTIPAGTNFVTINEVTYTAAESGVQITAAATSGQDLSSGVSAGFTVNPGNQNITFPSPGNQNYGTGPIPLNGTASSGLPVTFTVTSGLATISGTNLVLTGAGSVTIQASQAGDTDWNAAPSVNQTISVAVKTVTASFTANNKTYDGGTTVTIASTNLSGVINSDVVYLTIGSVAFSDKNVGNGKTVIATGLGLGGTNAGNYVLASNAATNTANISAATVTVTANSTNRPYGAVNPAFTVGYSGFVVGENTNVLNGVPAVATAATTNSPVSGGPYPITVTQGTLSATNYTFTYVNGNLTITPVTLTVSADNQSRPYGTTNPVLTASYNGFVNGETTNILSGSPALSTTAVSNSAPGAYTIQIAAGTLSSTNYVFAFDNGTLTVNGLPAILTIQTVSDPTNAIVLSTLVVPNSAYQILGSTDLVNWAQIGTVESASDGSLFFTNTVSSPREFYRTLGP